MAEQVDEIERMGRLRRFLPAQVADLIVAAGNGDRLLEEPPSRGDRGLLRSARLHGLRRDRRARRGDGSSWRISCLSGRANRPPRGTLERFVGDGLLVVFNDPLPCADHTERAVCMAAEMRDAIDEHSEHWRKRGYLLGFGIGIARGHATIGRIGFDQRSDYAVIGTVPNLAARLCEKPQRQILVSQKVIGIVEKPLECRAAGELKLKGTHRPVAAYDILRWVE